MMKIYRIKITGDRYPMEYNVQASSWATAAGRGIREWQKRFKGSRTQELKLHMVKSTPLLIETEKK